MLALGGAYAYGLVDGAPRPAGARTGARTDAVAALDGLGGLPRTAADTPIAPPPEQFDGPAPSAAPPAALARRVKGAPTADGTWAVVIGINDYPGSSHDLHSAVADAQDVDVALAGMGVPNDHRLLITDGQASAGVVTRAADWLVDHAGPNAVGVFFYAGHVRKVSSTTEEIVAADGRSVTDAELAAHLRPLRAAHAWIGMASCYGGGFTEVLGPGRVLTAAAGPNDLAYENPTFGRSYMVQYMIRQAMIDLRAPGTVQDAFNYARAAIAQDYPGREPVEYDANGGPLSLRPPGAGPVPAARPAPAPSSSASGSGSSGSGSGSSGSGSSPSQPSGGSDGKAGASSGDPPPANCNSLTLGVVHCS